jgi:hypothetical protein
MSTFHAYLTRIAVRVRPGAPLPDDTWLEKRFLLFEMYCLPSMRAQTEQGFSWLLLYDREIDDRWVRKLHEYQEEWSAVIPTPMSEPWSPQALHRVLQNHLPDSASKLMTSLLDSDDMVSTDYTARLRQGLAGTTRGGLVFDWGFNMSDGKVFWQPLLRGPFATVVAPISKSGPLETAWDAEHEYLDDLVPMKHAGRPSAWVQLVHGGNLANRTRGIRMPRKVLSARFPALPPAPQDHEALVPLVWGILTSLLSFTWGVLSNRARAERLLRYLRRTR